ncbi:hypothetical protein BGC07_03130 [Piscirickettsia litoralis]|uniref:Chemotaxis protein CheW n=1 Tax=Piscirickettsia litoralis TaxID=1891921 RepID=A0ABX3A551_9GAMM|nr:hypothetical protein BGC07_03130 [Piscirickettsia litoralis]
MAKEQYLTFLIADKEYGVNILNVQEIRCWGAVTPLPGSSDDLKGVMNLRGAIIPIVDLRYKMTSSEINYNVRTIVIVLHMKCEGKDRLIGAVVDAVSDVCDVGEENLREAPEVTDKIGVEYIDRLAQLGERMVILLDTDKISIDIPDE